MDAQNFCRLQEAYLEVYEQTTIIDKYGTRDATPQQPRTLQREETDLFDIILEYLVAEGYADTNQSALVIMANMSEEWRESIAEQITGGTIGITKRFGPGFGSGNVGVNASVQGSGRRGTNFGASGSLERGEFSGQGDRIKQGVDAAIDNFNNPKSNANTSTSTITKGTQGSFTANVSGGSVAKPRPRPVAKPAPKPAPIVEKPRSSTSSSQKPAEKTADEKRWEMIGDLGKRGLVDDRGNPYPGAIKRTGDVAGEDPNPQRSAQAKLDYPRLIGLQNELRADRERQATNARPVIRYPDGTYRVAPRGYVRPNPLYQNQY